MKMHLSKKIPVVSLIFGAAVFASAPVVAQLTPDNTLGSEASSVTPNVLINGGIADRIGGGARREGNLFHSFSEFNINDGQRVYFANPSGVLNILTRVTGGNASNILGTLGVDGNANLFLMNPNGILFGQNASLDIRGSFVGTTANGVQFGTQGFFNATNPQEVPLLTVNPSALFFNQINPNARIVNNSQAPAGIDAGGFNASGLRVPDGKSLLLVGGNVNIDGGVLNAFGGRLELGGLAAPGTIDLVVDGDNLRLGFPENVDRADVSLTNQSQMYVTTGVGGGNLLINARNIDVLNGSILSAGIFEGTGTLGTVAGDIRLNATGKVTVADAGEVRNLVRRNSQGRIGDIIIDAGSLQMRDEALIYTSSAGQGDAGSVKITATDDVSLAGQATAIRSTLEAGGVGKGGNIDINANSFQLRDSALLSASTAGKGDAGSVRITATDAISLTNASIFSSVVAGGVGKGGNIDINATSLSITDGAQLQTITSGASETQPPGKGDAGNVNIKVSGVVDIAGVTNGLSGIFSFVAPGSEGNGGNTTIDAGSFRLRDGALIVASTGGQGNAGSVKITATDAVSLTGQATAIRTTLEAGGVGKGGNIDINANSLQVQDGARLSASTSGQGDAGSVKITATDSVSLTDAGIFSTVQAGGVGKGGNIDINAASLSIIDGSQLLTATLGASETQPPGKGDAGNVNVKVSGEVDIAGVKNGLLSGVLSFVDLGTEGSGGNITIDAGSFKLRNSAQLSASTSGQGNAGSVKINATDAVSLADADIFSTVEAGGVGQGGNIDISAASLSIIDGSQLLTITRGASETQPPGKGDAGNVNVKISGEVDIAGVKNGFSSGIRSSVSTGTVGNGGNITIGASSFKLRDGARLRTSTFGQGNAGSVKINVTDSASLTDAGILSTVETGGVGQGGNIEIDVASLSLTNGAQFGTSTFGLGNAGNVKITATDGVSFTGQATGILSTIEAGGVGKGGNIDINATSLSITDGAQLQTITSGASDTKPPGKGDAGNVNVKVFGEVDIAGVTNGFRSGILSLIDTGTEGNGGNITINAGSFKLQDGARLSTSTGGKGNAGSVKITTNDAVFLIGNANIFSTVEAGGLGKGGNIDIEAASLSLMDGAQLQTATIGASATQPPGKGDAGNVNIKVSGEVDIASTKNRLSAIFSLVAPTTEGNGGDITIDASSFQLRDGAVLTASTLGQGNAGTIKVNATDFLTIWGNNSGINSGLYVDSASTTGTAGDIIVTSPKVTLDNQGKLSAESASGNGGNIKLTSDLLLLRRGGQINTNAGTAQQSGDGGNIDISSTFIVAIPNQNSDITANAFTGKGGNINIRTEGIFGIEPRTQASDTTNDITASSQLGVQGNVAITEPDVDPAKGTIELPNQTRDRSDEIGNMCPRNYEEAKNFGEFTITGRGSIPQSILELLPGSIEKRDLANLPENTQPSRSHSSQSKTEPAPPIIEAQGWIRSTDGSIKLVAHSQTTPPGQNHRADCPN